MSTQAPLLQADQLSLVRLAAEFRLIGLLLERPVNGWHDTVAAMSEETSDASLREAARQALEQNSLTLHDSTFGPGGPAAPREVSYRRSVEPGASLAELSACYTAFGFVADPDEPPDHIAVLLSFVSYLHFKQAYALVQADPDGAAIAREVTARLIDDHLRHMAHPLARLLEQSGIPFLERGAQSLRQRVAEPADRNIDQRLTVLETAPDGCCTDTEEDVPMTEAGFMPGQI